jgi:hypothetical protein
METGFHSWFSFVFPLDITKERKFNVFRFAEMRSIIEFAIEDTTWT